MNDAKESNRYRQDIRLGARKVPDINPPIRSTFGTFRVPKRVPKFWNNFNYTVGRGELYIFEQNESPVYAN